MRCKCKGTAHQVGVKLWEEVHPDNLSAHVFMSRQDIDDQVVPVEEPMLAKDIKYLKHASFINQWTARTNYPVF